VGEHRRHRRGVNPSGHGYGDGYALGHKVLFKIVTFLFLNCQKTGDFAPKNRVFWRFSVYYTYNRSALGSVDKTLIQSDLFSSPKKMYPENGHYPGGGRGGHPNQSQDFDDSA
jgi:hypothetical protein